MLNNTGIKLCHNKKTEISLHEFYAVKRSVFGRLSRLRKIPQRWEEGEDSPIQEIGVFEAEIQVMENTLLNMQTRLDNAKITIEI